MSESIREKPTEAPSKAPYKGIPITSSKILPPGRLENILMDSSIFLISNFLVSFGTPYTKLKVADIVSYVISNFGVRWVDKEEYNDIAIPIAYVVLDLLYGKLMKKDISINKTIAKAAVGGASVYAIRKLYIEKMQMTIR